jgi:hypothetical protein
MKELILRKNQLLLALARAKDAADGPAIYRLAMRAADLENRIAEHFIRAKRLDDAAVNLVSRASCLLDAEQKDQAVYTLQRARNLTRNPEAWNWIHSEIARLAPGEATLEQLRRYMDTVEAGAEKLLELKPYTSPKRHWRPAPEREVVE